MRPLILSLCGLCLTLAALAADAPRVALLHGSYGNFRHRDDYDGVMRELGWKLEKVENKDFLDYVAGHLVEVASIIYRQYLFLPVAERHAEKRELFKFFRNESEARIDHLIHQCDLAHRTYGEKISDLKNDLLKKHE